MKKHLNTFWARLALVLLMAGACVWFITEHNWLWLSVALPALVWAVWGFYLFYNYNNRNVAFLLDAIENHDPTVHIY